MWAAPPHTFFFGVVELWGTYDAGFYNIFDKKYQNEGSIYEPGRYFSIKMNARF